MPTTEAIEHFHAIRRLTKEMMYMHLANLFIPPLLAITTCWTYMHSKVTKVDKPTGEILGVFVLVIVGINIIWFVVSAPWFLNLGVAALVMLNNKFFSGNY